MHRPALLLAALALPLLAGGCAPVNRLVDHWALGAMSDLAARGQSAPAGRLPFESAEELERLTRPADGEVLEVRSLPQPRPIDDVRLTQEILTFPSAIRLLGESSNQAVAHVFRRGAWGERPVLLWVPGVSIGFGDWPGLTEYFTYVLEAGADVVLFEPPYHFSRAPAGTGSGEVFLSTDYADHLSAFAQEISDLRRLTRWLRAQGVQVLGAFGSSMGGGVVMRTATFDPAFDFLVLKQPLVDWNTVLRTPEMAGARSRIEAQGIAPETMARAYRALDSRGDRPKLPAARISLLYGRFDQVAPEAQALSLAEAWGISDVTAYPRGHALIMWGGLPYRDVPRIVARHLDALRLSRRGPDSHAR
ncbi:MAG TPA: hypothetical protein VGK67_34005 [Myxococcales bacterium]